MLALLSCAFFFHQADRVLFGLLTIPIQELPQSMIIVGGGVIGMEFATLYHELGVPVTVIEAKIGRASCRERVFRPV